MNCVYCGKVCKNENSKRNHERLCKHNPERDQVSLEAARKSASEKTPCRYCGKGMTKGNSKRHENSCSENPANQKECPVCSKMFSGKGTTCSYSCSNVYFKRARNKDSHLGYQALCFRYHGKKCLVCGEEKIVAAHHVNEDHSDNRPENLVPLCPTHHQYIHSRYRDEVQPFVDEYIKNYTGCSVEVT